MIIRSSDWQKVHYIVAPSKVKLCDVCQHPIVTHPACKACGGKVGTGHTYTQLDGDLCPDCIRVVAIRAQPEWQRDFGRLKRKERKLDW